MNIPLSLLIILLFSLPFRSVQGQQVVASGGMVATANEVMLTWTVGQPVSAYYLTGNTALSQGFQQPFLETVSLPETIAEPEASVTIYPNPFNHHFEVAFAGLPLPIQIINGLGQIIYQHQPQEANHRVETDNWSPGIYHLILTDKNTTHSRNLIKY
jgi:hypothetical protein